MDTLLNAGNIAAPSTGTLTASALDTQIATLEANKVPNTRTVNTKALSSNITLNQDEVLDGTTYGRYALAERTKLSGIAAGAQTGTVTAVSIASSNGISGTSSGGATPALTLTLGAITPTSVSSTGTISGTTGAFTGTVTAPTFSGNATSASTAAALTGAQATAITANTAKVGYTTALAKADCVGDTIADAVTDKAPSQNAVYDALALKANLASPTFTGTVSGITAAMVGLGSVNNTSDTAKPISTAQQTALDLKAPISSPTFTGIVAGISASMVGLGSVNNTADSAKPVSTAQQTALNLKANIASPTFTGTVTEPIVFMDRTSNSTCGITWQSLSGYTWVDYMANAATNSQGPSGALTVPTGTLVTGWGKRSYIENGAGYGWTFESGTTATTNPAIVAEISSVDGSAKFNGTVTAPTFAGNATSASTAAALTGAQATAITSNTAKVGYTAALAKADCVGDVITDAVTDKAPSQNAVYDALLLKAPISSPTFTGTVSGITAAMVGLGSVNNTADSAKPISTAQQAALDLKAPIASPTFTGNVTASQSLLIGNDYAVYAKHDLGSSVYPYITYDSTSHQWMIANDGATEAAIATSSVVAVTPLTMSFIMSCGGI